MNKVIHLSLSLADGTRSNGINPERRKSELDLRKIFSTVKTLEDTVWGRAGIIIIERIFKSNLLSRMTAVVTCLVD